MPTEDDLAVRGRAIFLLERGIPMPEISRQLDVSKSKIMDWKREASISVTRKDWDFIKGEVLRMLAEGVPIKEVSRRLAVTRSTVSTWRKKAGIKSTPRRKKTPIQSPTSTLTLKQREELKKDEVILLLRDGNRGSVVARHLRIRYDTISKWRKEVAIDMLREGTTAAEVARHLGVRYRSALKWRSEVGLPPVNNKTQLKKKGKKNKKKWEVKPRSQPNNRPTKNSPTTISSNCKVCASVLTIDNTNPSQRKGAGKNKICKFCHNEVVKNRKSGKARQSTTSVSIPILKSRGNKSSRVFGEIPGYPRGTTFPDRKSVSRAGVHRPIQAGISGSQKEGADSIVVSGGYIDDYDLGDEITYTGHGGNDPRTGRQTADQELTRGNLALAISCQNNLPVRVVRGWKGDMKFSPVSGYRYDGIYTVKRYWSEMGVDGYTIWRFLLVGDPPYSNSFPKKGKYTGAIKSAKKSQRGRKSHLKPEAITLVQEGKSGREVAKILGVGEKLIRKWRKEEGMAGVSSQSKSHLKPEAIALIREGNSGREVSKILGVGEKLIRKWKKEEGLTNLNNPSKKFSVEDENDVIDHLRDGKSMSEISRLTGVSTTTISKWKKQAEDEGMLY